MRNVLGDEVDAGPLLLLYFVSGMLAVPGWLSLSYRLGKHRTWSLSMLWACLIFAWVPFLGHGDVIAFAVICALSGASLGADLAIPPSMQADVVDLDRVMSGRRRTAFFFALWSMAGKLALAMAVGIAFPILGALGFVGHGANTPRALLGLIALYALLPVLFKLVATALVWRFELDARSPESAAGTDRNRAGRRITRMKNHTLAAIGVVALVGCSGMQVEDYAGTMPVFRPEEYFQGQTRAWGFFQDRFGTIKRQFVVDIDGQRRGRRARAQRELRLRRRREGDPHLEDQVRWATATTRVPPVTWSGPRAAGPPATP